MPLTLLDACFAAGIPLLTPEGSKRIEQFQAGDLVLSRSESDPDGPLTAQVVEAVFVRLGRILHVHVCGQVIRTTAEHPFWVHNQGWVLAGRLGVGDLLVGHDGQIILVEDVLDTEEYETVYNLRIAGFHTYFVGDTSWGFSVWAHNACFEIIQNPATKEYVLYTKTVGDVKGVPVIGPKSSKPITGKTAADVRTAAQAEGIDPGNISKLPDYLKERFGTGKGFDAANRGRYPYNEVEVAGPDGKTYKLDSYDPVKGEIVFRRDVQFADVSYDSAARYLREFTQKYPVGGKITNSQFNPPSLQGKQLTGELLFEIPVQAKPIPDAVLKAGKAKGITFRDVTGKIYGD